MSGFNEDVGWTLFGCTIILSLAAVVSFNSYNLTKDLKIKEAEKTARHKIDAGLELSKINLKEKLLEKGLSATEIQCMIEDPKGESPVCVTLAALSQVKK